MRPRSWSGRASLGSLAARLSTAFSAPGMSFARISTLISAMSPVVPLSAAATARSSASAAGPLPLATLDNASARRTRGSSGLSLAARAKLASAAALSPFISWACAASVSTSTLGLASCSNGASVDKALSAWPLRTCTWASWARGPCALGSSCTALAKWASACASALSFSSTWPATISTCGFSGAPRNSCWVTSRACFRSPRCSDSTASKNSVCGCRGATFCSAAHWVLAAALSGAARCRPISAVWAATLSGLRFSASWYAAMAGAAGGRACPAVGRASRSPCISQASALSGCLASSACTWASAAALSPPAAVSRARSSRAGPSSGALRSTRSSRAPAPSRLPVPASASASVVSSRAWAAGSVSAVVPNCCTSSAPLPSPTSADASSGITWSCGCCSSSARRSSTSAPAMSPPLCSSSPSRKRASALSGACCSAFFRLMRAASVSFLASAVRAWLISSAGLGSPQPARPATRASTSAPTAAVRALRPCQALPFTGRTMPCSCCTRWRACHQPNHGSIHRSPGGAPGQRRERCQSAAASPVSSAALPPAAAVLMVSVCSAQKR